jgi:hypothetical protein
MKYILLTGLILSIGCFRPYWGHHFVVENQLNQHIDSLKITIGDEENWLLFGGDSSSSANLKVPKRGYPHPVRIEIYSGNDILHLEADSFNCYNCDGSHRYILKKPKAEYQFIN